MRNTLWLLHSWKSKRSLSVHWIGETYLLYFDGYDEKSNTVLVHPSTHFMPLTQYWVFGESLNCRLGRASCSGGRAVVCQSESWWFDCWARHWTPHSIQVYKWGWHFSTWLLPTLLQTPPVSAEGLHLMKPTGPYFLQKAKMQSEADQTWNR